LKKLALEKKVNAKEVKELKSKLEDLVIKKNIDLKNITNNITNDSNNLKFLKKVQVTLKKFNEEFEKDFYKGNV